MKEFRLAIPINRSRAVRALFLFILILTALHGLVLFLVFAFERDHAMGFVPLFHLDIKGNIPTYFSSILLLIVSCLLFCVSRLEDAADSNYARQWKVLSILAILLSVDEISTIHEKTILPLRDSFDLSGIFYFSRVVIGLAGVAWRAITRPFMERRISPTKSLLQVRKYLK